MLRRAFSAVLLLVLAFVVPCAARADMWPDEPGLYPNRDYVHQQFAENIDPFTGNLHLAYVDGYVPGNGGFDLKVGRFYNSLAITNNVSIGQRPKYRAGSPYYPFGYGWTMGVPVLHLNTGSPSGSCTYGSMWIESPEGGAQSLYKSNGVAGTSQSTDYITLNFWRGVCNASGDLTLYAPDGTRYDMTQADGTAYDRLPSKITDRNGNYATLTYTLITAWGHNAPATITSNDGRTVSFAYSGGLLSTISVQGRTWYYTVTSASGGITKLTRVTPPAGASWNYTYNSTSSLLQTVQSPQGANTTYGYTNVNFIPGIVGGTSQPAVTSKSNSLGTWSYSYSPSSSSGAYDVTTVTLPTSLGTITYRHFGVNTVTAGQIWKIGCLYQKTLGSAQTETYAWSSLTISNTAQVRDGYFKQDTTTNRAILASRSISRDGGTFSTTYSSLDTFGNPQSISESGNVTRNRSLTYFNSLTKWIVGMSDDETITGVGTISRSRDANGNLLSESKFGVATTYGYDSTGSITLKTDARSNQTTYSTYHFGIPQSETRPAGVTISRQTDNYGNVTSQTDGVSAWTYSYDGLNRITTVGPPIGTGASISWTDTTSNLVRGAYSKYTQLDAFARPISIRTAGVTTTYSYDALGRKTFESLPGSSSGTTYTVDLLGRVTRAVSPVGTRSYSYAASSATITNERGKVTTYTYDRYGDPDAGYTTAINSPASTAVTMDRDAVGTLLSATQNGLTRTYGHDSHLFLTSEIDPETNTTTFGRDAIGNMTSKTVGTTQVSYGYDGLNRLTSITYGGTAGTVNITYDHRGKVTQVTNPAATRNYTYDGNGNLTQDQLVLDGYTFTVGYGFDGLDGLSSITYPMSKGTVTLTPDARGRPTLASPYIRSVSYFDSGNVSSIQYGNLVTMSYGEDARQLPTSVTSSSIQLGLTYGYDGMANVTSISNSYFPSESHTLGYDDADRLTSASGSWGAGSLSYSGGGNLLTQQLGSYSISYGYTSNRLSSITGAISRNYAYDGQGNVTSDGSQAFTFDNGSMMSCANCGGSNEVQYGYDGQGHRVYEQKAGQKTYFIQSPSGDLQFEYTPYGKVWTKNVFLHGRRVASEMDSDATVTTTSLSAVPSTVAYGADVTLTATISPAATGTAEFFDGPTSLGTANVSGSQAQLVVSTLAVGSHTITAQYSGNANYLPSTSAPASVIVN